MSMKPGQGEDSYLSIVLSGLRSPLFWSLFLGATGTAGLLIGGVIYFAFYTLSYIALWVLLGGAILVFLSLVLSPRAIAIFLVGRKGRYGTNVAVMTIAFFVILLIVNFFLYSNPTRIDVTATRVFSLSDQTLQIIDDLDTEVMANAFFVDKQTKDADRQQAEDLLNEFARRSSFFSYRFIDPELSRAQALKYKVRAYPSIVFESKASGKQQSVFKFAEQEFVTGILVSTDVQQKKIGFLIGHGEAAYTKDPMIGSVEDDGLDFAIEGMQRDNYRVLPSNLKQTGKIDDDTAVLVIAGPDKDLSDAEFAAIGDYIENGGKVLALYDPGVPNSFNQIIASYGVVIGEGIVADAASNVGGEMLTPMLQKANGQYYTSNQIGIGIADKIDVTFFPEAGSVEAFITKEDMPPHIAIQPIAITTQASWMETDPDDPKFSSEEIRGPFVLAYVITARGRIQDPPSVASMGNESKIIVFSDSDFATNKYFYSSDNANLFLNSINWLAEDYELISIRPKLVPYRELVVNVQEMDFIKWSSWIFPPALMLILSFIVWWRRR